MFAKYKNKINRVKASIASTEKISSTAGVYPLNIKLSQKFGDFLKLAPKTN